MTLQCCICDHSPPIGWPSACPKPLGGTSLYFGFIEYYDKQNGDKNAEWYLDLLDIIAGYESYVADRFDAILAAYGHLATDELPETGETSAASYMNIIETKRYEIDTNWRAAAYSGRALIPDALYSAFKIYANSQN